MRKQKYDNSKNKGMRRVPSRLTSVVQDIGQWKVRTLYTLIAICLVTLIGLYSMYQGIENEEAIVNRRSYGYKSNAVHDTMPDHKISNLLKLMYDTRPDHCRYIKYRDEHLVPASIIMHYNEDEFYTMKLSLQAVIANTADHLYEEIILFDDGSVREPVARHANEFLKRPEFKKVRMVRSESVGGPAASRFKASRIARSSVLVFVDIKAMVNSGWLVPLISGVYEYPDSIISSHNDVLRNHGIDGADSKFSPTPDYYLGINTWSLSTVYIEGPVYEKATYRTIPSMKGDVFAVNKKFLKKIGDYDDQLTTGGGHNLELGLRAWLCSWGPGSGAGSPDPPTQLTSANARLKLSVCSRVAVLDDLKPRTVTSKTNAWRIINLWYGNYMQFAHTQCDTTNYDVGERQKELLVERKLYMKNSHCRSMHWYLTNVAGETVIPTQNAVHFGQLRGVKTSMTFHDDEERRISLLNSAAYLYNKKQIFELSENGYLISRGLCASTSGDRKSDIPIVMEDCDPLRISQKWTFSEGVLRNNKYPTLCVQPTINRNTGSVPRLKTCKENDYSTLWQFLKS